MKEVIAVVVWLLILLTVFGAIGSLLFIGHKLRRPLKESGSHSMKMVSYIKAEVDKMTSIELENLQNALRKQIFKIYNLDWWEK